MKKEKKGRKKEKKRKIDRKKEKKKKDWQKERSIFQNAVSAPKALQCITQYQMHLVCALRTLSHEEISLVRLCVFMLSCVFVRLVCSTHVTGLGVWSFPKRGNWLLPCLKT